LREHNYVERQNCVLEVKYAERRAAALAAKHATQTIPIVMAVTADPLRSGILTSLARPGGNITGLALIHPDGSGASGLRAREGGCQLDQAPATLRQLFEYSVEGLEARGKGPDSNGRARETHAVVKRRAAMVCSSASWNGPLEG
jgi:hypothetical protein